MDKLNIILFIMLMLSMLPWAVAAPIVLIYKCRQVKYYERRFNQESERNRRLVEEGLRISRENEHLRTVNDCMERRLREYGGAR